MGFSRIGQSIGIIILTILLFLPARLLAETLAIPDADTAIKTCWRKSEQLRSGSTDEAREGFVMTVLCLEEEIVRNSLEFIYQGVENEDSLRAKFRAIRLVFTEFYWNLYNENNACMPSCGTQYYSAQLHQLSKIYEKILKDVIHQRNQYGARGSSSRPN
ncbi:hypothetical protein [Magnetospira sp. QH-2]|uniref:hypothetical protein n=1 Tax=Magnetospira sp. (strain QH-2) TaxID=1288970 RepID=UPI0011DE319F|nr:hypothetical protein [Magnetospira sp. QH-2]